MKKILIQESHYFNRSSWQNKFDNYLPNWTSIFELEFVKSNKDFNNSLLSANICFCFDLDSTINIDKLDLDIFYLGISDFDYKEKYILPEKIKFFSSKGVSSRMIAEYTLMSSLMLVRRIKTAFDHQRTRKWNQADMILNDKPILSNYKIGVLGLGANGQEIVNIFYNLGCEVFGLSRSKPDNLHLAKWYGSNEMNQILNDCDIIIVSLPLNSQTENLISKNELEIIGEKSFLINIGRGEIINEEDLIYALNNNIIAGAVSDVFCSEPIGRWSKLWKAQNFIVTPHISGNINSFKNEIQLDFIMKIKSFLKVK